MGKLIRSMDWSATPLGPVDQWPQSLRTSVSLCLSSTFPILIAWGPDTIQIYNDSYRPICGAKHPESMGMNFRICWETALSVVGDAFTRGQQGEGTYIQNQRMFLDRHGYLEEAFMTFSFAPIRDESGNIGGIFHPITESTEQMLSARRTHSLRELGSHISRAKTLEEICDPLVALYEVYQLDLPFLLFYKNNEDGTGAMLQQAVGLDADPRLCPIQLRPDDAAGPWLLPSADTAGLIIQPGLRDRFGAYAAGPYEMAPDNAVVIPLFVAGQEQAFGFLVAGVSACRALDTEYEHFYRQLGNTFNTAISNVYAYEQEQKRIEALAAIDRSKTAFFSNVSHEFRTPLALMLGPLEELMREPLLQEAHYLQNIDSIHRNAGRLLKLVNNLLDFSRMESDRVKGRFYPLDLGRLTVDLASTFRSIIEQAGMRLVVEAPGLTQQVFVDPEMWEKIVLNLISNAFKYTLAGTITVRLAEADGHAVLQVEDTGIGIPESELPHMFERFHRVAGQTGRTHEGTGIGLSLVAGLVQQHGGTIGVDSIEHAGSVFTVRIPLGYAHLPAESVVLQEIPQTAYTGTQQQAFLNEAKSLLEAAAISQGDDGSGEIEEGEEQTDRLHASILVVDDNTDMRSYLTRLLTGHFEVVTAANGVEALEVLQTRQPDLIISDIMMPQMDGKEFLQHLKADPDLRQIPLIFLSARAGEEARVDGLEAGADDYLIKPFAAKELLSKVRTLISRRQSLTHAERLIRNLFRQAPVALAMFKGPEHTIAIANDRMLQIWGKPADEILNRPFYSALPDLASEDYELLLDKVYQEGRAIIAGEIAVRINRLAEPEDAYLNLTFEPLRDESQRIYGVMAVAAEVTALVNSRLVAQSTADELEQYVAERTKDLHLSNAELKRANAELEQYAYVTSHDLQEPVRKILVFSEMLRNSPGISEQMISLIGRIGASSQRMSALIRDLLSFSLVQRGEELPMNVDLNELMESILTDFDLLIDDQQANVQIGKLPPVQGNESQLRQLFSNLVANALKFRKDGAPAQVTISAQHLDADSSTQIDGMAIASGRYHAITIRDEGIGFDNRYRNQVFEIFKKLNSREEYPGSGIGLAICKRIVHNHGGYLWAESEEMVGTTMHVLLPAGSAV